MWLTSCLTGVSPYYWKSSATSSRQSVDRHY